MDKYLIYSESLVLIISLSKLIIHLFCIKK